MASSKSGSGGRISLHSINVEQLKVMKEQTDLQVNLLQDLSLRPQDAKILVPSGLDFLQRWRMHGQVQIDDSRSQPPPQNDNVHDDKVGAASSLAPKIGPVGLSRKRIGEDIAKETAKDWKGLKVTVKLVFPFLCKYYAGASAFSEGKKKILDAQKVLDDLLKKDATIVELEKSKENFTKELDFVCDDANRCHIA
ncbi:Ribosomal protein L11, N-terminal [Sesbania bispinosa]|nr:Ribosomal protein L11, N-terminal [Sesbania bispinosa]